MLDAPPLANSVTYQTVMAEVTTEIHTTDNDHLFKQDLFMERILLASCTRLIMV